MKKKAVFGIGLVIFAVFVVLFMTRPLNIRTDQHYSVIKFITHPSPPMYKEITNEEDITKIVALISGNRKFVGYDYSTGWELALIIDGEWMTVGAEGIIKNGRKYYISAADYAALIDLYKHLDYEEKLYSAVNQNIGLFSKIIF